MGETFPGSGLSRESIEGLGSPLARRVEVHDYLDSTQRRARELARGERGDLEEAAPHGTLVVCGVQTGGRGRYGRTWGSPAGGLWMSMVLRPDLVAEKAARVTQASAVGVAKALWEFGVEARIKWPNDLLVEPDGRKVCGILAESGVENAPAVHGRARVTSPDERKVGSVVLGVGLNANLSVEDLGVEDGSGTTLRARLGRDLDLLDLLAAILSRLDHEFSRTPEDFDAVLGDWKALDCTLGHPVRVQSFGKEIEGRAVDLTSEGALIIETPRGRVEIFEGEVQRLRREA